MLMTDQYVATNVPNPVFATVTYRFDQPARVSGVEIVQHVNGITQVEGFLGNSLPATTSLGAVFGPSGDVTTGFVAGEAQSQIFPFINTTAVGTYFQLVVRKTVHPVAFANYRIFPPGTQWGQIYIIDNCFLPIPQRVFVLFGGLLHEEHIVNIVDLTPFQ